MNDERLSLTSASNALPDLLCPGRHLAQRGIEGYASRDSEEGTMIHNVFADRDTAQMLSPSMMKTLMRGREIEMRIALQWLHRNSGNGEGPEDVMRQALREQRFWITHEGQKIHSGQIDAFWLNHDGSKALIEDLKTLFGDHDDADRNLQLRDYAALLHVNLGCAEVSVFINQPNTRWRLEDQQIVTYNLTELEESLHQMHERVLRSNNPESPRIPGIKQCQFCLACATPRCPESIQMMRDFAPGFAKEWEFWAPEERAELIRSAKLAATIAEKALNDAKVHLTEDPKWAPGWRMSDPQSVRKIDDVAGLAESMVAAYGPDSASEVKEAIIDACKVSISDIEAIHARFSKANTADDKKAEFNVLYGHLIQKHMRSGSLKEEKP